MRQDFTGNHNADPSEWAREFCKQHPEIDEGRMIGWFANAIMAGYDVATPDTKRWREICEIEPRILVLAEVAKAYHEKKEPPFCANAIWYGELKEKMSALVGWEASKPELRNEEDYDLVYDTIYGFLPNCDHDGACWE